jgi:hypothetical protein
MVKQCEIRAEPTGIRNFNTRGYHPEVRADAAPEISNGPSAGKPIDNQIMTKGETIDEGTPLPGGGGN